MWIGAAASLASSVMGGMDKSGGASSSTSSTTDSNTNSSSSKGTEQSKAASSSILDTLLADLQTAGKGYDKQSAINDSEAAAKSASSAILQSLVPGAFVGQNAAGGYSSTSTKRAVEDAQARAAAAYAGVVQDSIAKYANITSQQKGQDLAGLSSILSLIQDSATSSESKTHSTTESTTTGTSSQSGSMPSAGNLTDIINGGLSLFGPSKKE